MCEVEPREGSVCLEEEDFALDGDMPFFFTRRYSNHARYVGSLGLGWIHPYDVHLSVTATQVTYVDEEAREIALTPLLRPGETCRNRDESLLLECTEQGYLLHGQSGKRMTFAREGGSRLYLKQLDKTDENTLWFDYENGRLTRLQTSSGHVLLFFYEKGTRLQKIVQESSANHHRLVASYVYDTADQLTYAYDAAQKPLAYEYTGGLLVRRTNRLGGSHYLEYDSKRRCTAIWQDGIPGLRRYQYDDKNHTTILTDALGRSTLLSYDDNQLLHEIVYADASVVEHAYADGNQPLAVMGASPPAPLCKYDELGNVLEEVEFDGAVTKYKYDRVGRMVEESGPDGVSQWKYNAENQITTYRDPAGGVAHFAFTPEGLLAAKTTYLGNVVRAVRSSEAETRFEDNLGRLFAFSSDGFGAIKNITSPSGNTTRFTHDLAGRLSSISSAEGYEACIEYDAEGYLSFSSDYLNNQTKFVRDPFGLIQKWVKPLGRTISYEYDAVRRLTAAESSTGAQSTYAYDVRGRLTRQTLPDGQTQVFSYDAHNNRVSLVNSAGLETKYNFSDAGFLTEISSADVHITYDYDLQGNCCASSTAGYTVNRTFGPGNRLLKEVQGDFVLQYEYNDAGLVTIRRDSTGRVTEYGYNVRGQLVELKDSLFGACRFNYDLAGRQSEQVFPNGMRQEYSYTTSDAIASVVTRGRDGTILTERMYGYDPTGEIIIAETFGRDREDYAYDGEYHLLEAIHDKREVESFRYDLDENVIFTAALGAFQYDGSRLRAAGPLNYAYDASGRVVERKIDEAVTQFSYGLRGLIRTVTLPDGSIVDYEYDGFGRRVRKHSDLETVNYYWDGDVLLAETRVTEAGATTVSYLYIPGSVRPLGHAVADRAYFYDLDQRSVIREVYDSHGREAARYRYRAFGERQVLSLRDEEADPPFRLLGQTEDRETGLYYNRFRYYDPVVGRYIVPDPYLQDVDHNSYAYGPNPIRWADPLGLMPDFSQAFLDKLLAANKAANGGMYKCENCGFTNSNKVYAVAPKSGRPVGDGAFHGDHFPVCNADGGDESTGGRVLGGVCNCSRGKGRPIKMT